MKLEADTRVVVCDGGRYVIYENHGDIGRLDLRVADSGALDNPATRDQGSDRPGRYPSPGGQRSSVEQTDWHDTAEQRFIDSLADKVSKWAAAEPKHRFVLIADPRSMGRLRARLPEIPQARILKSITGDYVHQPVKAVEELIASA
ncbi:MAG: host attachment family protein [Hyphomonas sp.]